MTDSTDKIELQLSKHNNILLYKQDLEKIYQKRNKTVKSAYIISPRRGKEAFKLIYKKINNNKDPKNKTISQLIEEITENSDSLHIYIDYFEQLIHRELDYYRQLEDRDNIQLIVNIRTDREFISEDFLEKFIIDGEEYYDNRTHSTNITDTLLLLVSLLIFLVFMRLQLSILSILVNTLWFTLLMYRTFSYMVR
ncbi:MAG: hypothetical protein LUG89_04295 [Methanosphaera sp.]|nr:hypothetical protein [Methanosphaera sp.]